jgi:hypothetical protein
MSRRNSPGSRVEMINLVLSRLRVFGPTDNVFRVVSHGFPILAGKRWQKGTALSTRRNEPCRFPQKNAFCDHEPCWISGFCGWAPVLSRKGEDRGDLWHPFRVPFSCVPFSRGFAPGYGLAPLQGAEAEGPLHPKGVEFPSQGRSPWIAFRAIGMHPEGVLHDLRHATCASVGVMRRRGRRLRRSVRRP